MAKGSRSANGFDRMLPACLLETYGTVTQESAYKQINIAK
jgi:hypothetical protein